MADCKWKMQINILKRLYFLTKLINCSYSSSILLYYYIHIVNPYSCSPNVFLLIWRELFLISGAPRSSCRIVVTSVFFFIIIIFKAFVWLEIGEIQVIFPIPLYKASKFSKVQGLQLKGGNCFVSAPILLACATKGKRANLELVWLPILSLSQLCIDKCSCTSLPGE